MAIGNVITNSGKNILINRGYKSSPDYTAVSVFKVGINNGTPSTSSTDLDSPIPISGTEAVDACDATTSWTASGTNSVALNTTAGEFKEGTGCINIIKSDASSVNVSVSKTTTSRDFTSKDFWIWVYLDETTVYGELATTSCIEIRFGSDNSNYYYKQYDKADVSSGWNALYFSSSTATGTTGTPVIAACDYSFLQLTSNGASDTWSGNACRMDNLKVASSGDYTKIFVSGFPTFDYTNNEVTIRCFLDSTEANGYEIDSHGLFNTDGTVLMGSESTFTAESKSTSDEIAFICVERLI